MMALIKKFRKWLNKNNELEHHLLVIIVGTGLTLLFIILFTDWGFFKDAVNGSRNSLLSSIIQGLTTILALLVTFSLVATQLTSSEYTPRAINMRLKDFWLWSAIIIYLIAIIFTILILSGLGNWLLKSEQDGTHISVLLTLIVLIYLMPFTLATLKSLKPDRIAGWMVKNDDRESLDDLMRKAVNDGKLTILMPTLNLFTDNSRMRLNKCGGAAAEAGKLASLYISIGRHSCQRQNPDALGAVMDKLTSLVSYCNEHPRMWRGAADIFNEAVKELYFYSEECFIKK